MRASQQGIRAHCLKQEQRHVVLKVVSGEVGRWGGVRPQLRGCYMGLAATYFDSSTLFTNIILIEQKLYPRHDATALPTCAMLTLMAPTELSLAAAVMVGEWQTKIKSMKLIGVDLCTHWRGGDLDSDDALLNGRQLVCLLGHLIWMVCQVCYKHVT